jgi:2-polyprenyl-3-methyl-5-hydroxy-6-metoxy-1,4-benzoquinol methylase
VRQPADDQILVSWEANASPWIAAIDQRSIESRRLVTDRAIIESVLAVDGDLVLDIGCGEGWLARELSARGRRVTGIDGIASLIRRAKERGGGEFRTMAYEALSKSAFDELFDIAVCNFSLIGKASVEQVFRVASSLLRESGCLIVQTLHPVSACGELPYCDGWREGSWQGFSEDFTTPAPWYFRTLESWLALFQGNGFEKVEIREPIHPNTGQPVSLLVTGINRKD